MFRRRLLVILTCASVFMSVLSTLGYVTSFWYGTHFSSVTPAGYHTFNYGAGGCCWEHRTTGRYLEGPTDTYTEHGIPGWFGFFARPDGTRMVSLPGLQFLWCFQASGYSEVYVRLDFLVLAVVSALAPTIGVIAMRVRSSSRRRRGRCLNCGYDLTGNESKTCPECGTPICNGTSSADEVS